MPDARPAPATFDDGPAYHRGAIPVRAIADDATAEVVPRTVRLRPNSVRRVGNEEAVDRRYSSATELDAVLNDIAVDVDRVWNGEFGVKVLIWNLGPRATSAADSPKFRSKGQLQKRAREGGPAFPRLRVFRVVAFRVSQFGLPRAVASIAQGCRARLPWDVASQVFRTPTGFRRGGCRPGRNPVGVRTKPRDKTQGSCNPGL